MKNRKCATGGMVHGPKSMQDQLIAIRPKFADGGKVVDPVEELLRRTAQKYGTAVPPPATQVPVAPPAISAQQPERGLLSLPGKIQQRSDEVQRVMDYDKPKPRGMAMGGIAGTDPSGSMLASIDPLASQSQGVLGAPDYSTGPKQTGFTWDDGTRRDGLTPEQAQRQDAQAIATPVSAATSAPLLTMAEKQVAQGFNPNAAYRPGGPGDPHSSSGMAASVIPRASAQPTDQWSPPPPMPGNPLDTRSFRQRRQAPMLADGGMVRFAGKGGPREDKIPVKVAGQQINVSDGENAVILPAKTAANPQAIAEIAGIIRQSNDGRHPDMGGVMDGGRYANSVYPYTDDPVPTAQQIYAPVDVKGMVSRAFPSTMSKIQKYGDVAQQTAAEGNYGGALGHVARGGLASVAGVADDVMRSAAYALDPAANALKTFVTGDSAPINKPLQGATQMQQENYRPSAVQPSGMAAKQVIPATPDPRIAASTGNAGNSKFDQNTGTLTFTKPGFNPMIQKVSDGTGMISLADGKTQVFTNMSPNQYTATDGTPNARWEQTQAYQDAIARNEADKMRLAETMAVRQGMNPVQAIVATQGLAQAAQRAPLDRSLIQQQIEQGRMTVQNAQRLQAAADAVTNARTPEERLAAIQTYHAINGKGDGKPVVVNLGEEISTDGMTKRNKGEVALDPITYRPIPLDGAASKEISYTVKVGMPVNAPDGIHTFQGKQITVKSGKVVEVK